MWLEQQKFISHGVEAGKFKVKVPADLVSGEDSLPGFQVATFSLHPHMAFLLCSCGDLFSGPIHMMLFKHNCFIRALISEYSHTAV